MFKEQEGGHDPQNPKSMGLPSQQLISKIDHAHNSPSEG